MHIQTLADARRNDWPVGVLCSLLLAWDASESMTVAWMEVSPGSVQGLHMNYKDGEQAYIALSGRVIMTIAGEEQVLMPGTLAWVPPHTKHGLSNRFDETAVLAILTTPPAPFMTGVAGFYPDEI